MASSARRRSAWGVAVLAAVAPACVPALDGLGRDAAKGVTRAPADGASCASARDPLRPLIVEWPATNRVDLETAASRGAVVVRYQACELTVLAGCRAGTTPYEERATQPAEDRVEIDSTRDLHRDLPLGAGGLERRLDEGQHLSLAYVTVGARVLDAPPVMLQGECAGATHYVSSMVLGAFGLTARDATQTTASAEALGASARDVGESKELVSGSSGDLATCKEKGLAAGASCGAVIELGLRPLDLVEGKPAAAGFGLGLAPPARVPDVPSQSVAESLAESGGDFERLDVTSLELLQAARRAERDPSLSGAAKAEAWGELARQPGAYAALAARRQAEWSREASAEEARRAQVVGICPRFREDHEKLARLLALDDGVVPPARKQAYQREIDAAYAAWPELVRCPALETAAAYDHAWAALHGADDGMVHIPGATFLMGSTLEDDHAAPVHSVTVEDFDIDATEVTVERYERCQRRGACTQRSSDEQDDTWRCNDDHQVAPYAAAGGERLDQAPANCATYAQAEALCRFEKKRLPTEEEWELAARGTDGRRYPWGEWGKKENGYAAYSIAYCPFATYEYRAGSIAANASAYGVRDMAGSVFEWTTGRYSSGYGEPAEQGERTLRGGYFGWSDTPDCARFDAAYRLGRSESHADSNTGIRCAR